MGLKTTCASETNATQNFTTDHVKCAIELTKHKGKKQPHRKTIRIQRIHNPHPAKS